MSRVCSSGRQAGTLTFKFAKRGITEANLLVMANHLLSSSIMTDPALTIVYVTSMATLQTIGHGCHTSTTYKQLDYTVS